MFDEVNPDILIAVITGSLLLFVLCIFIIAFSILYKRKRQQHILEKQQLIADYKSTLLKSRLEIKEQTLQHIAREVYANLTHGQPNQNLFKYYKI